MNANPTPVTASPVLRDAWLDYHQTLEQLRLQVEATPRFQETPQHRAKAYHTLMEMQAMAYNFAVAPRMLHPRVFLNSGWQTHMFTLGQNGPDFLYGVLFLDGRQTYRMRGRMGDITLFLVQVLNGLFGEKDVRAIGNFDFGDFKIEKDGTFEVMISAEPQPGNWIKLDGSVGYQFLLIRRALPQWDGDHGELTLDRVSELAETHYDADEFDEAAMAARIRRAASFVRYLVNDFNINLYDMYFNNAKRQKNVLTLLPGTVTSQVGSPTSNYAMAVFELKDDEAVLIDLPAVPDAAYWSFQLGDVWSRSLEYCSRQTSLSDKQVAVDEDGAIRIVVSATDPGVHNWMDTCGRVEGTIVFRNYRTKNRPVPSSRKVKLGELEALLPKGTRRVTPAERKRTIESRRQCMLRTYGE